MSEPILARKFLNSILVPDPVLAAGLPGGWHELAPAGVASPYGIVRQHMSGRDETGLNNGGLIWVPLVFQVNVYDRVRQNFNRLDPLADQIYSLLQAINGNHADGIIYGCYRIEVDANFQVIGDVVERYILQKYQIDARSE